VNAFERRVRAAVYATLRDEAAAPSVDASSGTDRLRCRRRAW
jgi:hypothetical protein